MASVLEEEPSSRFPWGYAVASLVPVALVAAVFVLPMVLDPRESMGPAMLCSLLIGPVGVVVVGWGVVRLWRGDARRFPALRWLVWLPALVGGAGFLLS